MATHTLTMACGHQQGIKACVPAEHLEEFLAQMSSVRCDRCSSSSSSSAKLPSRDGRGDAGDGKPYNCSWCGLQNVTGPCRLLTGHDLKPESKKGIAICIAAYVAVGIYCIWNTKD